MALTEEQIVSELNNFMIAQDPNFVPQSIKVVDDAGRGTMISIWMEQHGNLFLQYLKIPLYFKLEDVRSLLIKQFLNTELVTIDHVAIHEVLRDYHISAMIKEFKQHLDKDSKITELVDARRAFSNQVSASTTDDKISKFVFAMCIDDVCDFLKESEKILSYKQVSDKFVHDVKKMARDNYCSEDINYLLQQRLEYHDSLIDDCAPADFKTISDHMRNLTSDLLKCINIVLVDMVSRHENPYRLTTDSEYRRKYAMDRDWGQYERDLRGTSRTLPKSYPEPSTKSSRGKNK